MVLAMRLLRCLPLLLLPLLLCCGDPVTELARVVELRESGDDAATETALRAALERHPDDLELLLVASDFYLLPTTDDFYRPRLALHYAMRADQAGRHQDERATRAMVMAHRGAGGFDEAQPLIREGLAGLGHPDAEDPVRLKPVDRDLLEPTLPNLVEQRRRETDGTPTPTCADGLLLVPKGEYPPNLQVADFCVEERGRPAAIDCALLELRSCDSVEAAVAAGLLAGLLLGSASDARCCSDPTIVRVKSDPEDQPDSLLGDP